MRGPSFYSLPLLLASALATPQIAFPFNSQVPPVARVGKPYSFTISPTTFRPNGEDYTYSLGGAPAWLSMATGTATLIGTPGTGDVGSFTFTITASDSVGSIAMPATLVVVSFAGPQLATPISAQLAQCGKMSSSTTVEYLPQTSFSIDISPDTFSDSGKNLSYYATLGDHTPLPAWLDFDPVAICFSGTTPAISQSPQNFNILLIASDVVGFSGAVVGFTLSVSVHQFEFQSIEETITIKSGQTCSFHGLRDQLMLDGKPIEDDDYGGATSDAPSWLTFDPQSLSLIGTPPAPGTTQELNVTITASDRYGDSANTTVGFYILSGLFAGTVGELIITPGQFFEHTFSRSLFVRGDLEVGVELGSLSSWLHFATNNLTIYGTIPVTTAGATVHATLTATEPNSSVTDHLDFEIVILPAHITATSTISGRSTPANKSTSTPTSATFAQGSNSDSNTRSGRRSAGEVVGIVIAVVFAVVCLAVSCWFCRTPKEGIRRTKSALKRSISRPLFRNYEEGIHGNLVRRAQNELGIDERLVGFEKTPERPPQIMLDFSPIKGGNRPLQSFPHISPRKRHSEPRQGNPISSLASAADSLMNNDEAKIFDNFDRTSWGYGAVSTKHKPHDAMKIATQLARSSRPPEDIQSVTERRHTRQSSLPLSRPNTVHRSVGLPVSRRLTGLGHGRTSPVPDRASLTAGSRVSCRYSSFSTSDFLSDTYSLRADGSSAAPRPPLHRSVHLSRHLSQSSSRYSLSDSRQSRHPSLQRPIPRRSMHRSAFFAGGPNPGAARRSRGAGSMNSSRGRNTMLGLSTIRGSPDLGSPEHDHENADPEEKARTITPKSQSPIKPPLRRGNTQTSQKTSRTWVTTTSGGLTGLSTRSASSELLAPPPLGGLVFPSPPMAIQAGHNTLRRGRRTPRPISDVLTSRPSARSSLVFRDPHVHGAADIPADYTTAGAEPATPADRSQPESSSLYSQSETGSPTRQPGSPAVSSDIPPGPVAPAEHRRPRDLLATTVRRAADRLKPRSKPTGKNKSKTKRTSLVSARDIPIMQRPRSSFRPLGARQTNAATAAAQSQGNNAGAAAVVAAAEEKERIRVLSGKGKRPVSNDGLLGAAIGSLRAEMRSGKGREDGGDARVRGNEAFL